MNASDGLKGINKREIQTIEEEEQELTPLASRKTDKTPEPKLRSLPQVKNLKQPIKLSVLPDPFLARDLALKSQKSDHSQVKRTVEITPKAKRKSLPPLTQ